MLRNSWTRKAESVACMALTVAMNFGAIVSFASAQEVDAKEPTVSCAYQLERGTGLGWLIVSVDIPEGSHIYSLTQKGSLPPSKITVGESKNFHLLETFHADRQPLVVEHDPVFDHRIETHETGEVHFLAPFKLEATAIPEKLVVDLAFDGLCCSGNSCKPLSVAPVAVTFGGYYDAPDTGLHPAGSERARTHREQ